MFELTILRGNGVKLVDVEFTELFNVNRSTVFISPMIELGVILVDFFLLWVVESVTV